MHHHDEDMIDFPVSNLWRDHYAAQGLTAPSGRRERSLPPLTPNHSSSDYDDDRQTKINDLMAIIRRQRAEISTLKAIQHPHDSRESFEGIEV